jgi:hypothetical protein
VKSNLPWSFRSLEWNRLVRLIPKQRCIQGGRSTARAVETDQAVRSWRADDGEDVAAQSRHHGLAEAEHHGPGDGGVDGIAAAAEHVERGLGRERMRRAAHGLPGEGDGSAGPLIVVH